MTRNTTTSLLFAAVALLATGCGPVAESGLEEQRDPHFLTGKARGQALDYNGAIQSFQQALEVNPRSASAHFELGLLYEPDPTKGRTGDPVSAIYHFQRFLELRKTSEHEPLIRQRILACKQEIARNVSLAPVTMQQQRDLDRLAAENTTLQKQVAELQRLLNQRAAVVTNYVIGTPTLPVNSLADAVPPAISTPPRNPRPPAPPATSPAAARTHVVQAGENPSAIARKHGITLNALMAANPGLKPDKLKPGQTVKLPTP